MGSNIVPLPTINIDKLQEGWKLQKLSQKHKNMIALHCQNVKREDIGQMCNCTPEYVSMILAQPLAREYLREVEKYMDSRLESLYGRSVDAIEAGLNGSATDIQLKAARLQMEATGKLKGDKAEAQSAEDVVAALLKHASSVGGVIAIGNNVQVNTGE
jgi:predicted component of type VI protein secretion system